MNAIAKKPTLVVRTLEQAACWLELDGQISDGHWENATPHDHWEIWCKADVRVAAEGEAVGRDFYARRTNYNLSDKRLLDIVGKRMLGIVRLARAFGLETAASLEHDVDCDSGRVDFDGPTRIANRYLAEGKPEQAQYWVEKSLRLQLLGREAVEAALADETYTMRQMRADLKELRAAMQMWRG